MEYCGFRLEQHLYDAAALLLPDFFEEWDDISRSFVIFGKSSARMEPLGSD